jgi:hypothetical protein
VAQKPRQVHHRPQRSPVWVPFTFTSPGIQKRSAKLLPLFLRTTAMKQKSGREMVQSTWWHDESGAVSVDLMALSGLLIVMSLGLISNLQSGTVAMSTSASSAMDNAEVMQLGTLGQSAPPTQ